MFAQNPKTQLPEEDGGPESGGAPGEQPSQRLHLVKGVRDDVDALTKTPVAHDVKGETERVSEEKISAEAFSRSAVLRMTINDFFRRTSGSEGFFDMNKADIQQEVLQMLGHGEGPQKKFLRDRCKKYDKNYPELTNKIKRAFENFQKQPIYKSSVVARKEAGSRLEVSERTTQFIQAGAFESTLSGLFKRSVNADTVRQASAEYLRLSAEDKVHPGEKTTPVLYSLVQRCHRIFNSVSIMTHLRIWIAKLNKARDAFGRPVEATTPELAPLKGERRLEVVEQFLMSDSVNEILRQFLRKAVDNADVLFSAKTALGQFLLTGFRDIDHIRRIQHRGINFEALARAVFSSFQKYRRSAEGSEGASEDRDVG